MTRTGEYAVPIKVHVSEETAAQLRELAARDERSVNWLVRKAIAAMLSTEKPE